MIQLEYSKENLSLIKDPEWILIYSTIEHISKDILNSIYNNFPNTQIFGTTSFNGVFTPTGFKKGCFLLVGEKKDGIKAFSIMKECNENNAFELGKKAAEELVAKLGKFPDSILFHPTPGFEETIINGLESVLKSNSPIYGGSAADNTIGGQWKIFNKNNISDKGFVLIGFVTERPVYGAFVSGYLPTQSKGKVTKANKRIIYEIDNRPATEVYNEWIGGLIDMTSDNVILAETTLKPIGKVIGSSDSISKYLISHPHQILSKEKALSFFTDFNVGDEISLMFGSKIALLKRVEQTVSQAIPDKTIALGGGILIYCAGCVGAIMDKTNDVSESFVKNTNNIPFLGAATFGEQGCFKSKELNNLHGNLMCCATLFS